MFFHTNNFLIHFLRKGAFRHLAIHVAQESRDIGIQRITLPSAVQKDLGRLIPEFRGTLDRREKNPPPYQRKGSSHRRTECFASAAPRCVDL